MNILSIGNSFSDDATRYVYEIAKADGVKITTVNVSISGCPLERHYRNMLSDKPEYRLEVNGVNTDFYVTLKDALLNRTWDYITIQQASHLSPDYETYQPFLDEFYAYIKKHAPKAKVIVHQTWAYADGDARMQEVLGYKTRLEMFSDIEKSYAKAAEAIGADRIIRSGALLQELLKNGVTELHRDKWNHVTYGLGRYAVGLLWYRFFTGNDVTANTFSDFDEPIAPETCEIIKKCVMQMPLK